eukprot:gene9171-16303_t
MSAIRSNAVRALAIPEHRPTVSTRVTSAPTRSPTTPPPVAKPTLATPRPTPNHDTHVGSGASARSPATSQRTTPPTAHRVPRPGGAEAKGGTAKSRTVQELNNPVQVGAKGRSSAKIREYPGSASLSNYMLLPVEQYFVLDPERIKHLEGSRFLISVPRVDGCCCIVLEVEVEEEVELKGYQLRSSAPELPCTALYRSVPLCTINPATHPQGYQLRSSAPELPCTALYIPVPLCTINPATHPQGYRLRSSAPELPCTALYRSVLLNPQPTHRTTDFEARPPEAAHATRSGYRLRSSDQIEKLRLNEKFTMKFHTELTWRSSQPPTGAAAPQGHAPKVIRVGQGEITGNASLDVWSETFPPFSMMPKELVQYAAEGAVQASVNMVMHGMMQSMLPLFTRLLGEDYQKWGRDEQYRKQRALRSQPLVKPTAGS